MIRDDWFRSDDEVVISSGVTCCNNNVSKHAPKADVHHNSKPQAPNLASHNSSPQVYPFSCRYRVLRSQSRSYVTPQTTRQHLASAHQSHPHSLRALHHARCSNSSRRTTKSLFLCFLHCLRDVTCRCLGSQATVESTTVPPHPSATDDVGTAQTLCCPRISHVRSLHPSRLYPLFWRSLGPNAASAKGMQVPRILKQPSSVHAHCGPRLRNIWTAKRGKVPPRM
jgi:hypothetical protein